MKTVGILSAILVNVALFTLYYVGLGQEHPMNSTAYAESAPDSPRADSSLHLQSMLRSKPTAGEKRSNENGEAEDRSKEVLDGKQVIEHKEVIDPKDVAEVGEFSDPVSTPIQPLLPNTEFRSPNRKLGISSAPNSANLQPPVISPESR
ncbi:MAG: hypothetical protein H7Y39_06875 [Nitrospiraceae bacterium]|nr:hypothetical protein [Nitrospiraceae bacterium]